MKTTAIKNLIFDLGGVIINLDQARTFQSLQQKSGLSPEEAAEINGSHELFLQYEKGLIDDVTFRDRLRETLACDNEGWTVDPEWNSMLLDIPVKRIELLRYLREKYNLYLLSNTNGIHVLRVNEVLKEATGLNDFTSLFDKLYFSHEMGMRKPDREIFLKVMHENNLSPEETLFIDDNYDNIASATSLNIRTLHVTDSHTLFEYFENDR